MCESRERERKIKADGGRGIKRPSVNVDDVAVGVVGRRRRKFAAMCDDFIDRCRHLTEKIPAPYPALLIDTQRETKSDFPPSTLSK